MKIVSTKNLNTKEEWDTNWKNRNSTKGFRNITMDGSDNGDLHSYEKISLKYHKSNSSVLEMGCGDGFFLKYLKGQFDNIEEMGADISSYGVEDAKKRYDINCVTIQPFEYFTNKKFDYVISHQVIEHVDEPEKFLDYLLYFLKEKGTLVISSVTDQFNYDRYHMFSFDEADFQHLLYPRFEKVEIEIFDVPSRPKSQIIGVGSIKKK